MAKVKVNEWTNLAPVFLLREFGGNVAGDVAGFPEKTAQSLVDQGYAQPYNSDVHDQKSPNYVKSTDARMQEVAARMQMAQSIAEFRPAEVIHEDEDRRVAALAEVASTERFIPSTTTTRQEIEDSGALTERAALTTADLGLTPGAQAAVAAHQAAATGGTEEPPTPPRSTAKAGGKAN